MGNKAQTAQLKPGCPRNAMWYDIETPQAFRFTLTADARDCATVSGGMIRLRTWMSLEELMSIVSELTRFAELARSSNGDL
jgi:hypothetical protein